MGILKWPARVSSAMMRSLAASGCAWMGVMWMVACMAALAGGPEDGGEGAAGFYFGEEFLGGFAAYGVGYGVDEAEFLEGGVVFES